MTRFNEIFADLAAPAIDAVFGEQFECTPMTLPPRAGQTYQSVNASRVRDGSRPKFTFVGCLVSVDEATNTAGRRTSRNATRGMIAPGTTIDFSIAGLPDRPREGDLLKRIATGAFFLVAKVMDEDGRSSLVLGEISGSSADP